MVTAIPNNFPGNSYAKKNVSTEPEKPTNPDTPVIQEVEIEIVPVASGSRRKKSAWDKLIGIVRSDDTHTVGGYILKDVILPSIRDLIYDVVTQGAHRSLYRGGGGPVSGGIRGGRGRTRYEEAYRGRDEPVVGSRNRIPTAIPKNIASNETYDEIEFDTHAEANTVLQHLSIQIEHHGFTTVADLYRLSDVTPDPLDSQWGWDSLVNARVTRNRAGSFVLNMPPLISLR